MGEKTGGVVRKNVKNHEKRDNNEKSIFRTKGSKIWTFWGLASPDFGPVLRYALLFPSNSKIMVPVSNEPV